MSLKCKIGFHSWHGCKCSECMKIRDEQHDWSNDCEKCSKCDKTFNNQHNWSNDCEKCSTCSKSRDNQHNWSKDCEKCSICGKSRENQHNWIGCICGRCGKTRDEQHDWSLNCEKCSICGKYRDNKHDWKGCICPKCFKTRNEQHNLVGCYCSNCGKENHNWTKDSDFCICEECGTERSLIGKTVVAAGYSLVEPYQSASEQDRRFHCIGIHPWGGYSGYWLIDGQSSTTASFDIEKVLD